MKWRQQTADVYVSGFAEWIYTNYRDSSLVPDGDGVCPHLVAEMFCRLKNTKRTHS